MLFSCSISFSQSELTWFDVHKDEAISAELDCELKTSQDQKTNVEVVSYDKKLLFVYNNPQFAKIYPNDFLIKAYAGLEIVNENHFMVIDILIKSTNARKSFGEIKKNSTMKIFLANGEHLLAKNIQRSKGQVSRKEGTTSYRSVLILEKSHTKQLAKQMIQKIGFMWEEGISGIQCTKYRFTQEPN